MPDGAPIPVEGTNDYRRDREGNVIVTRLNETMCQEIAKEGKGIYVRVDNSNSAQKQSIRKSIRWQNQMWNLRYIRSLMNSSKLLPGLFYYCY